MEISVSVDCSGIYQDIPATARNSALAAPSGLVEPRACGDHRTTTFIAEGGLWTEKTTTPVLSVKIGAVSYTAGILASSYRVKRLEVLIASVNVV